MRSAGSTRVEVPFSDASFDNQLCLNYNIFVVIVDEIVSSSRVCVGYWSLEVTSCDVLR
jgi:hypothetical protein